LHAYETAAIILFWDVLKARSVRADISSVLRAKEKNIDSG
jgi:hypothetical protein